MCTEHNENHGHSWWWGEYLLDVVDEAALNELCHALGVFGLGSITVYDQKMSGSAPLTISGFSTAPGQKKSRKEKEKFGEIYQFCLWKKPRTRLIPFLPSAFRQSLGDAWRGFSLSTFLGIPLPLHSEYWIYTNYLTPLSAIAHPANRLIWRNQGRK